VAMEVSALLRRGAMAVAVGRVALGAAALARPSIPARPWVGAVAADSVAGRVFGRALGGRDLALGLGTLTACGRPDGAGAWIAAGVISDVLDVAVTMSAWRELPRTGRWLVLLSAGGAAAAGAAGAISELAQGHVEPHAP